MQKQCEMLLQGGKTVPVLGPPHPQSHGMRKVFPKSGVRVPYCMLKIKYPSVAPSLSLRGMSLSLSLSLSMRCPASILY